MKKKFFIPVAACLVWLSSCKMADAVIIKNKSTQSRKISVIYPSSMHYSEVDSLQAWDLSKTENEISTRDIYRYSVKLPVLIDTSNKIFSFNLGGKHEVTVMGAISKENLQRMTFKAGEDSLRFKRQGNCWIFLINK